MTTLKQNISVLTTKIVTISGDTNIKGDQIPLGIPTSNNFNGAVSGWTSNTYVTDAIDQLNKELLVISGQSASASKKVLTFNNTSDWTGPLGGYYSINYLASSHGKGFYPSYKIQELISTDYYDVLPDTIQINSSGDITMYVIDVPDGRFSGRIIVV